MTTTTMISMRVKPRWTQLGRVRIAVILDALVIMSCILVVDDVAVLAGKYKAEPVVTTSCTSSPGRRIVEDQFLGLVHFAKVPYQEMREIKRFRYVDRVPTSG